MWMIASEATARDLVWHSRNELCDAAVSTLQAAMSDADNIGRVMRASDILADVGWHDEALQLMRRLCESNMTKLDTAHCRFVIARLLMAQGKYREALDEHKAALTIKRAVPGKRDLDVAKSRSNIGKTLSHLDQHEKALEEHKAALTIRRAVLGKQHPSIATSRFNIGLTLSRLGKHHEALVEHNAALAIRLAVLGEQHPRVAASRTQIANLQELTTI
jgi:tetratricopeptide (TPR) repeat protein